MGNEESEEALGIPPSNLNNKREISYEQIEKLMYFNTKRFWHCFYDPETEMLYNEYCRKIMDDATEYLIGIGLLSKDKKQIKYFEE